MTRYKWNLLTSFGENLVQEDSSYVKLMDDVRIYHEDYMIGVSHPMYADTLNVRDSVEHENDGSHKTISTTDTIVQSYSENSYSTTTGAFVTAGGMGINKSAFVGINYTNIGGAFSVAYDGLAVASDKSLSIGEHTTTDSQMSVLANGNNSAMAISAPSDFYPGGYVRQTSTSGGNAVKTNGPLLCRAYGAGGAALFEAFAHSSKGMVITTESSGDAVGLRVTTLPLDLGNVTIIKGLAAGFMFNVYGDGSIQTESPKIDAGRTLNVDANGYLTTASPSDERLKTDVQDIEYGIDTIKMMNPVSHYWTEDSQMGAKRSIGFIAQELEKLLPEVVSDGSYKSVNYPKIVPVIIKAIQQIAFQLGYSCDTIGQEITNG